MPDTVSEYSWINGQNAAVDVETPLVPLIPICPMFIALPTAGILSCFTSLNTSIASVPFAMLVTALPVAPILTPFVLQDPVIVSVPVAVPF